MELVLFILIVFTILLVLVFRKKIFRNAGDSFDKALEQKYTFKGDSIIEIKKFKDNYFKRFSDKQKKLIDNLSLLRDWNEPYFYYDYENNSVGIEGNYTVLGNDITNQIRDKYLTDNGMFETNKQNYIDSEYEFIKQFFFINKLIIDSRGLN